MTIDVNYLMTRLKVYDTKYRCIAQQSTKRQFVTASSIVVDATSRRVVVGGEHSDDRLGPLVIRDLRATVNYGPFG